jgi:hypothetical protein
MPRFSAGGGSISKLVCRTELKLATPYAIDDFAGAPTCNDRLQPRLLMLCPCAYLPRKLVRLRIRRIEMGHETFAMLF